MNRIDAHIHFWQPACGFDNRPVADNPAYRRDFLPADIAGELERCGIRELILVQAAPQADETRWLLALAQETPSIVGVTGWIDLDDVACDLTPLLAHPKLVGIRAQLRRIPDPAFVLRPVVLHNIAKALHAGLGVTLLAEARHYGHVEQALERLPAGPITFNHLGMRFPDVDADAWRQLLRMIARRPATFLQLSGLPFLFGDRWRSAEAAAVLDEAYDLLGPSRLMFASDWPMLVRFATYTEWVDVVDAFLARRGAAAGECDAIHSGNARAANPRLAGQTAPLSAALQRSAAPTNDRR